MQNTRLVYTGKAVKPEIDVYDGNIKLELNKDYTVSYKNNKKVYTGTDEKYMPQAIIKGKGNYEFKQVVTFAITAKNIADGSAIEGKNIPQVDENGTVIKVTAKGIGNYAGSEIFTTYRVTKYLINSANVKVASKAFTGTATTITKEDIKSIKVGKVTLTTDDYEIVPGTYKNNTKVGTAKVTIKGVGAFGGTKEISFRINKKVK